jgi:plasmid stability protein
MASITIRSLDDSLKSKLRIRAAHHGRSMEAEAREILKAGLTTDPSEERNLWKLIRQRIEPLGGVELTLPVREFPREPPDFKK